MPSFRRPLGIGKNEDGLKANESSVEDIFLITFEESGIYTVWKKRQQHAAGTTITFCERWYKNFIESLFYVSI